MAKAKKKSVAAKKKPQAKKRTPAKKKTAKRALKVAPIPKGYRAITPYLIVNGGKKAIEFYKKAFGAKANVCMEHSDGKIGHAELTIGDSIVMMGDECPQTNAKGPKQFGGSPISIHLYVTKVDEVVKRAVNAGGKLIKPVENQFYGDRCGAVEDPFGHTWYIASQVEKLTVAQIKKRAKELFGNM